MNGDDISKSLTTLTLQPVRTGSPRETLESFQQLSQELKKFLLAYQENQNVTAHPLVYYGSSENPAPLKRLLLVRESLTANEERM